MLNVERINCNGFIKLPRKQPMPNRVYQGNLTRSFPEFACLLDDETYMTAAVAQDIVLMIRYLASSPKIDEVLELLDKEEKSLSRLILFTEKLYFEPYDKQYRHPNDLFIVAAMLCMSYKFSKNREVKEALFYYNEATGRDATQYWIGLAAERLILKLGFKDLEEE